MDRNDIEAKFLGGMIGSALGDAIGELFIAMRSKEEVMAELEWTHKLRYTDDTAMAIGIAQSLIEVGAIEERSLGDTFARNYREEPWRGYAVGPPSLFKRVEEGGSYIAEAQTLFGGTGSFGNGAAMRIVPLGLYYHQSDHLEEEAALSAKITHTHPLGIDGAILQARAVAMAVNLEPEEEFSVANFCAELIDTVRTDEFCDQLTRVRRLLEDGASNAKAAESLGTSIEIHRSVPYAIFSFLNAPASFEKCLFGATAVGGDSDTIGAMAAGISGAYLGVDAIPESWREKLENHEMIAHRARELLQRAHPEL